MRTICKALASGAVCLLLPAAGVSAGIFDRPFEGQETITAAEQMGPGGEITPLPAEVGTVGDMSLRFTPTQGGFDVLWNFEVDPNPNNRTTASSLNGNNISWDQTFTENGVDVSVVHFTGVLSLDEATDAYTINGSLNEEFLVTVPPPGITTLTNFDSTFVVALEPAASPTGVPLPGGVWLGAAGLLPLAALRRRLFGAVCGTPC